MKQSSSHTTNEVEVSNKKRNATSIDVAKAAGVSRATVSYVLSERSGVKITEETRKRVLQAAEDLNYRPSAIARQLRKGVGEHILIYMPSLIVGPTYPKIFAIMGELAFEQELALTIQSQQRQKANLERFLDHLNPRYVASLQVWSESEIKEIERSGAEAISLDVDELLIEAAQLQWKYLHERGAKSIAYILPEREIPDFLWEPRFRELQRLCALSGMEPPQVLSVPSEKSKIISFALELIDGSAGIDGICGQTDEVLVGIIASLRMTTEDIQTPMIGLSNLPISRIGLTTVDIVPNEWAHWWMNKIFRKPTQGISPREPKLGLIRRDT
ncbi:LacI family DNA-binding transcriptional regulator [Corynebacterium glutamicum]|uniref:LacI family DNA-binding transcriptional regulator n=1 Tax=Corynebacterium glutamicum TaxID=1718 RepID=UPI0012DABCDD|nr:LacI family DNA-binding transcriptional regulator [Corynebacterium glutamicum]